MNDQLLANDVIRHVKVSDRSPIPTSAEIIHAEPSDTIGILHIWYRVPEHFDEGSAEDAANGSKFISSGQTRGSSE